jgi:hypothetical protein
VILIFSQVSVAVRIVPSPDWFVGFDSLQLCKDGFWIDALSVQVKKKQEFMASVFFEMH